MEVFDMAAVEQMGTIPAFVESIARLVTAPRSRRTHRLGDFCTAAGGAGSMFRQAVESSFHRCVVSGLILVQRAAA
jgi:hypothetical protein